MSQTSVNDTFSISFWEARKASWRYTNLSSAFVKCFNEVRHGEKKWSQFTSGMWFRIFRTDWHTKKIRFRANGWTGFGVSVCFWCFCKVTHFIFFQPQIFQRPYRQSIPPTAAQPLPFWTYSCDRNLNLSCRDVENDSISMGWSPCPGRLGLTWTLKITAKFLLPQQGMRIFWAMLGFFVGRLVGFFMVFRNTWTACAALMQTPIKKPLPKKNRCSSTRTNISTNESNSTPLAKKRQRCAFLVLFTLLQLSVKNFPFFCRIHDAFSTSDSNIRRQIGSATFWTLQTWNDLQRRYL